MNLEDFENQKMMWLFFIMSYLLMMYVAKNVVLVLYRKTFLYCNFLWKTHYITPNDKSNSVQSCRCKLGSSLLFDIPYHFDPVLKVDLCVHLVFHPYFHSHNTLQDNSSFGHCTSRHQIHVTCTKLAPWNQEYINLLCRQIFKTNL